MMLLKFDNLEVADLVDKGSFYDKQDPCLRISIDNKEFTTERAVDSGVNANFSETFEHEIGDRKDVTLSVEVFNKSVMGSLTHLGKGSVNLSDVIISLNVPKSISIELDFVEKKKTTHQGKVLMRAVVIGVVEPPKVEKPVEPAVAPIAKAPTQPKEAAVAEPVTAAPVATAPLSAKPVVGGRRKPQTTAASPVDTPEPFKAGSLAITKIEFSNLKNVEFIGKNDVFMCLQLKSWQEKTAVLDDIGANGSFEGLRLSTDVTANDLQFEPLTLQVWDHNSITSNKLIGEARVPLLMAFINAGAPVEIPVEILDSKVKVAGNVTVTVQATNALTAAVKQKLAAVAAPVETKTAEEKPTPTPAAAAPVVEPFSSGVLKVKTIKITNTKNVEIFGKNDLYACLSLGAWSAQTECMEDVGSDALFDYLDYTADVTADVLQHEPMTVQVWDKNSMTKNVLIGEAKVPLLMAFIQAGQFVDIPVEIHDPKNKVTGTVVLTVGAMKETAKSATIHPSLAKQSFLRLHRVRASKLKGDGGLLGMSSSGGSSDVFIKFSITNAEWKAVTPIKNDVPDGASVLFDHMDSEAPVASQEVLQKESVEVEVYDKNTVRNRLIGRGSKPLLGAGVVQPGQESELSFSITDESGAITGEVVVYVSMALKSMKAVDTEVFAVPAEFTTGFFRVKEITARQLKNVEWLGKQDPFVSLEFGEWAQKTYTQTDAESDCFWDGLPLKAENITKDMLEKTKLKVSAFDDNDVAAATLIGTGEVSLLRAVSLLGKAVDVMVPLVTKSGISAGQLIINIEFFKNVPVVVDPQFKSGMLTVNKMSTNGVKGGIMSGNFECFVELKQKTLNWMEHSGSQEGGNAVWDKVGLDLENISLAMMHDPKEVLEVEVYEVGIIVKKTLLGSACFPLGSMCPTMGKEIQLDAELVSKTKTNGIVTLFVCMQDLEAIQLSRKAALFAQHQLEEEENRVLEQLGATGGMFIISGIKGYDLKNTELSGKQDPFVKVSYGAEWEEQTEPLMESGKDVVWNDVGMELEIPDKKGGLDTTIRQTALKFQVLDKNNVTADALIGTGELQNLLRFVHKLDNELEVTVNLVDGGDKPSGRLIFTAELRRFDLAQDDANQKALEEVRKTRNFPKDATEFVLHICRARCFELKDTELVGKLDPYLRLSFRDWKDKTHAKDNAGTDVLWDYLDMKIPGVTLADLDTIVKRRSVATLLNVEVWDVNTLMSDSFLGKGGIQSILKMTELDTEYEFNMDVMDKKKKLTGRVSLFMKLELPNAAVVDASGNIVVDPKDIIIDKAFSGNGFLHVNKIAAFDLRKVETITTQDPYVCVSIRDRSKPPAAPTGSDTNPPISEFLWKETTEVKTDGGVNVKWDYLDLKAHIMTPEVITKNYVMDVYVYDQNSARADVLIGYGCTSYHTAAETLDKVVELSVDLKYDVGSKSKSKVVPAGRVTLFAQIRNREEVFAVKEGFTFGMLKIARIRGFGLKNTELFGKQDPFVELSLGDVWTEKTPTIDNGGDNVVWDDLVMQCEVMEHTLVNESLAIKVWEENTSGNVVIGTGSAKLLKCGAAKNIGKEVELTVEIVDDKANPSGKIVIYAIVTEVSQKEAKVPDDFKEGTLQIKKIAVSNLVFNKMFDECDPFVQMSLNDVSKKTITLDNVGKNPAWSELDFKYTVDHKTLKSKELTMELWDENSITSNEMIGVCQLPIRRAGGNIGKDVEVFSVLTDSKTGKGMGKLAVTMQVLKESEALKKLTKPKANLPPPKIELPADFQAGIIEIVQISAFDLMNKELVGKNDPYVKLTYDDDSLRTDTLNNAGNTVAWKNLELQFEVDRETLLKDKKFYAIAMDENTSRGDVVLGKGEISIRKLTKNLGNNNKLKIDLVDETGAMHGRLEIVCVLRKADLSEVVDAIPDSAIKLDKGTFSIKQIDLKNLKGAESMLGNKDPYIKISVENVVKLQTKPQDNAGSNATWKDIDDMKFDVTGDAIRYKPMVVTVVDKNVVSDEVLGVGEVSMKRVGMQEGKNTEMTVAIKDKKGKKIGTVVITALAEKVVVGDTDTGASEMGTLQIATLQLKDIRHPSVMAQTVYVRLAMGTLFSHTTAPSGKVKKDAKIEQLHIASKVALAQVSRNKLKATIMAKSSMGSDTVLGVADISLVELMKPLPLKAPWPVIITDVLHENKKAGKIHLTCAFIKEGEPDNDDWPMPTGGDEFAPPPEPGASSKDIDMLRSTCESIKSEQSKLSTQVGGIHSAVKQELLKDVHKEQKKLQDMLAKQTVDIKAALEAAMKQQLDKQLADIGNRQTKEPEPAVAQSITNVSLPEKISTWRSVHVQAWIAIQLGLSQYMDTFAEASIDGLVLLNHIDESMLVKHLKVVDALHRIKIMEAIKDLQARQRAIVAEEEARRAAVIRQRQAALAAKEAADRKKAAKKKLKKAQGKKKKKKTNKKMWFPEAPQIREVKEQHGVDRIKLERDMRLLHKKQQSANAKSKKAGDIWKFEYTGGKPKTYGNNLPGTADNIWNQLASDDENKETEIKQHGSMAYQLVLSNLMQSDSGGAVAGVTSLQQTRGRSTKKKTLPQNASLDEIFTVLKGAMFEVSSWLLQVEEMTTRRKEILDSDMLQMGNDVGTMYHQQYDAESAHSTFQHDHDPEGEEVDDGASQYSSTPSLPPPEFGSDGGSESDAPPAHSDGEAHSEVQSEYETEVDSDDEPPPLFSETGGTEVSSPDCSPGRQQQRTFNSFEESEAMYTRSLKHHNQDRVQLVFNAFINQESNGAKWLGKNDKLTRLKFAGGIESLLRLELSWPQFDMLWTKVDYQRSGEIDLQEFRGFFGDIADFEAAQGTAGLTMTNSGDKDKSMNELTKCLYQLADTLRYAGFTVVDMFASFDRNGSGGVSVSEFCSMLRVIIGNDFDKRLIYRALILIDTDGDKSISLDELLKFVYQVWRTQIDDLGMKLQAMAEAAGNIIANTTSFGADSGKQADNGVDRKLQEKLFKERNDLKEAIKRNFTREIRDKLEATMTRDECTGQTLIQGPFASVLQRMGVGSTTSHGNTKRSQSAPSSPDRQTRSASPTALNTTHNTALSLSGVGSSSGKRSLAKAGANELLRYKISGPCNTLPTRVGTKLSLPSVYDMNKPKFTSSFATAATLDYNTPNAF